LNSRRTKRNKKDQEESAETETETETETKQLHNKNKVRLARGLSTIAIRRLRRKMSGLW
jgi:hypothetical protein